MTEQDKRRLVRETLDRLAAMEPDEALNHLGHGSLPKLARNADGATESHWDYTTLYDSQGDQVATIVRGPGRTRVIHPPPVC